MYTEMKILEIQNVLALTKFVFLTKTHYFVGSQRETFEII